MTGTSTSAIPVGVPLADGAEPDRPSVVVVGGGLAGIAAAVRLADRGHQVRLLESRSRLGGATYSFGREGLRVDTGQHVALRCYREYLTLMERMRCRRLLDAQERLDLTVLLPGGRRARLRRGTWPAPLQLLPALARYTALSAAERASAATAAIALRRLDPDATGTDQHTFAAWLRRHHQSERAIRRLWGMIALAALNLDPAYASLALATRVFQTGLFESSDGADVIVPRVPIGDLHAGGARWLLPRLGVKVSTRARVTRIDPGDTGYTLRTSQGDLDADQVVIATPHDAARRLVPVDACTDADRWPELGSSAILNAHFVFDRPVLDVGFAAAPDTSMQWLFDRTVATGLRQGQYLVTSVSDADRLIESRAEEICRSQLAELYRILPQAGAARVLESFVTREPRATFRQRAGVGHHRPPPHTRLPGLAMAGAWTATGWPDTMEGAVRSGLAAADVLCPPTPQVRSRSARTGRRSRERNLVGSSVQRTPQETSR